MVEQEGDNDLDSALQLDIEMLFTTPASRKRRKIFRRLEQKMRAHRKEVCPRIAEFLVNSTFQRFKNEKIDDLENTRDILIFYSAILKLIKNTDDFEELLRSLAEFMEPNNSKLPVAVEWFKIFIKTLGTSKHNRQIRRCLKIPAILKHDEDTEIMWLRFLFIASKYPNHHTPSLIDCIASLMPSTLSVEQISLIKKAARCFLFPFNNTKFNSTTIKTLDDVHAFQTKSLLDRDNIDKIDIDFTGS